MRRGRVRRGRVLLPVLLAAAVAVGAWLLLADGTTDTAAPPAAVVNGPPALKHRAEKIAPSKDIVHVTFKHPPRAGLLFDLRNGQVLWARNPLRRLPIASLTKIMTAILVVESTRPRDRARVTREALAYEGSGVGVLPKRKRVPVEGLLAGMLLPSGNDAALALADHVAGTDRRFVRLMNRRAKAMGLGCTRYASSDGLEDSNRSCAADLAALARVAMGKRRIARLVRKPHIEIRFPIKSGHLWLNSTNPLLRLKYPGTIGLKTGSTDRAGHCLVAVVRRGNRVYGVVLLHSPDTGRQAKKLFDAAFRLR
jgi:D-alanyl-D-alanine carboxypeptidase (penicillin-binding protein 5/6)